MAKIHNGLLLEDFAKDFPSLAGKQHLLTFSNGRDGFYNGQATNIIDIQENCLDKAKVNEAINLVNRRQKIKYDGMVGYDEFIAELKKELGLK